MPEYDYLFSDDDEEELAAAENEKRCLAMATIDPELDTLAKVKELKQWDSITFHDRKGHAHEFVVNSGNWCANRSKYAIHASEYSKKQLARFNNDSDLAFEKTGIRYPLTPKNVYGHMKKFNFKTCMDKTAVLIWM